MVNSTIWPWLLFTVFILGMLALDLGIFHRRPHEVRTKEALAWSMFWIFCALSFNFLVYLLEGSDKSLEFLTAYLIEKSLSLDNIFVFVLIFSSFSVPLIYQHRILFWGILGALIMRGIMIGLGTSLIHHFHWVIYIFGAFLLYTAVRTAMHHIPGEDITENPLLEKVRKVIPVTRELHGRHFFTRQSGRLMATPLFLVLVFVEFSDVLFAVDSIPAILAISTDPFIVFTSNIFAILGLRSLYFVVANLMPQFYYLQHGLSTILGFVGAKMLLSDIYQIPTVTSLVIIVVVLIVSVVASMLRAGFLKQAD